jgi:phage baseplate assembly protein gpV
MNGELEMAFTLYDSGVKKDEKKTERLETSILEGTVVNNCDPANQGKVLVRIPSLGQEVLARLSGPGAGDDAGLFFTPNPDAEVLVGFSGNNVASAFILNGIWNNRDKPPVENGLVDVPTKRVLKTGLTAALGHKVEFDDGVGQSITITTATKQQLVLGKDKIEISTTGGTAKIVLDLKTQKISIQAPQIEIGDAKTISLTLNAQTITIGNAKAQTSIQGAPVKIN